MLIILAGITLNAVIGENGIIFQAKDTKNLVDNETKYDNEQLASLQNELKDNQLYSGIGIIPGTDIGGGSEGSENGTSGNQGGTNTNTGGDNQNQNANVKPSENKNPGGGTIIDGKTDEDPKFYVVSGEEIAASFFQSDVTIQIYTNDRSKKIKYILTTTVTEITNELYPSGLVRELDIENGGTLTFTKDGEYTITAYAYDSVGNKSNPTIMWFKRQMGGSTTGGITLSVASGNKGENDWYTTNVTLRVLGTDSGSSKVKYRIQGTATGTGELGDLEVTGVGNVDTKEVEIANGTTFRIVADGNYTITAYSYDRDGMKISSSKVLKIKKDATRPTVKSFTGEQIPGQGFKVTIDVEDLGAGLTSTPYTYRYRLAETNGEFTSEQSNVETKTYTGLNGQKTYDMYAMIKDEAGNVSITDVISKPSLWISNSPTAGETSTEGARSYYRSNIELTFRGQDSNNVDILKTTYQISGTVTEAEENGGAGSMDGTSTPSGTVLPANEVDLPNDKTTKTIQLAANGNWTVKVRNYNKEGRLATTNSYEITRDTIKPSISSFIETEITDSTIDMETIAIDLTSGFARENDSFQFFLNGAVNSTQVNSSYQYKGLSAATSYTLGVKGKDKAGNFSEIFSITLRTNLYYLVDKVGYGDYVAFDAGVWSETKELERGNGATGGYYSGDNKGVDPRTGKNGWRVLRTTGSGADGYVTLVSAGCPAQAWCIFTRYDSDRTTWMNSFTSFITSNFNDNNFASAAGPLISEDSDDKSPIVR